MKGILRRVFHGRRLGPLFGPWLGCILVAGLVFLLEYELPAFHEVVKLLYFVIAVVFVIATGRWFRIRGTTNRRAGDRRKNERRHGQREA